MRDTIGLDVKPREKHYFRFDVKNKNQPFESSIKKYVMKSSSVDLFNGISKRMGPQEWDQFTQELTR